MNDLATFSFGNIKTTWLVVDGTGESKYEPENIVCHYEPEELVLPIELEMTKQRIAQKKNDEEKKGVRRFWNGPRYRFKKFQISRTAEQEKPQLDLWFSPSDYLNFLATNMSLDDRKLRDKYLQTDWQQPVEYFSKSFAVYLALITSDEYLIITRRGENVMSRPSEFNISFSEGLSRSLDHINGVPDIYNCAIRGAKEELGINLNTHDINLLSFGVDTQYSQWALLGTARINKTKSEINKIRSMGISDKWENTAIDFIKFDIDTIVTTVMTSSPWAPGALVCMYHAMVYEFGNEVRDKLIKL